MQQQLGWLGPPNTYVHRDVHACVTQLAECFKQIPVASSGDTPLAMGTTAAGISWQT